MTQGWFGRACERLVGYEPAGRWRLYRRAPQAGGGRGLPEQIPVPPDEWRSWKKSQSPDRLSHEQIVTFAQRFVSDHPRHRLTPAYQRFIRKAPLAKRVEEGLAGRAWEDAEEALREILTLDGTDDRARLLLALVQQNQGKLDDAETIYREVAPRMETEADYHAFRGGYFELREQPEEARAAYQRAQAIQPDHGLALERLAAMGEMVEIYLGDLDHPQKAYLTVAAYEKVILEGWDGAEQSEAFYLERSSFHLRNGQPALALRAAERAAELGGGKETHAAGCRALVALERYDDAAAALAHLQAAAPEDEETFSCLGHLLWFRGEREGAVEWVHRAIEANPNRVENLHLFLHPEFPRPRRDALACLRDLLRKHPQSWAVKSVTAALLMAKGEWSEGIALATQAAELGASEDVLVELTGRLGREGLHRDVVGLIDAAGGWRRFRGGNALLRSNLASSLHQVGDTETARELWGSVAGDESAHPEVRLRAREALAAVSRAR